MPMTIAGELMEQEIGQQPEVLHRLAESLPTTLPTHYGDSSYEMVLLAARGSSDNAALYARYLIEIFLGIPVVLAAPSVLTQHGRHIRYPKCLAIGISQSGAAPDVAEVLDALKEDGHDTLAITNTEDSRLAHVAAHTIYLGAGTERSVAATKTYSASLLALYEVVRSMGAGLPTPTALPDSEWMTSAQAAAEHASGAVVRGYPLFALGRGFGFSTAHESALKLMECALLPCKAYSSADFEHGPKALAGHGSTIISYDGSKPHLADQGADVVMPPAIQCEEPLRPIFEIIFGQYLALSAARARGLDPDRPRHLKKVTETR